MGSSKVQRFYDRCGGCFGCSSSLVFCGHDDDDMDGKWIVFQRLQLKERVGGIKATSLLGGGMVFSYREKAFPFYCTRYNLYKSAIKIREKVYTRCTLVYISVQLVYTSCISHEIRRKA